MGQTPSSLPTITQESIKRVVVEDPTPPRTENQSILGLVFFRLESRGWRSFQHSAIGVRSCFFHGRVVCGRGFSANDSLRLSTGSILALLNRR